MKRIRVIQLAALLCVSGSALGVPDTEGVPLQCYQFDKYPAGLLFDGPFKAPDTKSDPKVHAFRTVIRAGAKGPPTFAGHLRIADWGCGTDCHMYALVDLRTGKVTATLDATWDIQYRVDSRLIVVDGGETLREVFGGDPIPPEGSNEAMDYMTRYYLYDEKKGRLVGLPGCTEYEKQHAGG